MLLDHRVEELLIISSCSPIRIARRLVRYLAGTGGRSLRCHHHGSEHCESRVRALIADQVIPVFAIHNCGCEDSPLLDVGPIAGVPAGRA
jgi:hypothetical protein